MKFTRTGCLKNDAVTMQRFFIQQRVNRLRSQIRAEVETQLKFKGSKTGNLTAERLTYQWLKAVRCMHDDVEIDRSSPGESRFLHQFQVRYRLLDSVLGRGMHVAALMQGPVDGRQTESRLGSNLFQGKFSHVLLVTPEDDDSFIILLAIVR